MCHFWVTEMAVYVDLYVWNCRNGDLVTIYFLQAWTYFIHCIIWYCFDIANNILHYQACLIIKQRYLRISCYARSHIAYMHQCLSQLGLHVCCLQLYLPLTNVRKYVGWQWRVKRHHLKQEWHQIVILNKSRLCFLRKSWAQFSSPQTGVVASQGLYSDNTYTASSRQYGVRSYWVPPQITIVACPRHCD